MSWWGSRSKVFFCFFVFFGACQCFVRLWFVFLGCLPMFFEHHYKTRYVSPRFQRHQMQKTSVFTVFCAHFHSKITSPWSPALKKKCQKMTRGPLHGPLLSSGGILLCGSSLRWSLELCFLTLGMLAMSTAWKIHCNWRCFIWKSRKASINGGFS